MSWTSPYIGDLVRQRNFPLRAARLFYCNGSCFRSNGVPHISRFFEVSLRLGSAASLCEDQINGNSMKIPFPNTVFKRIGSKLLLAGEKPRDTISFSFDREQEELLEAWGMIPEELYWPIQLNDELQRLINRWRQLVRCYTVPGMADQLDLVCFQIIQELLQQREPAAADEGSANRIQKAALYLLHHYDREINCDEVAAKFGFSHAAFFREWKRFFDVSPKNSVLEFRLDAAARQLVQSSLPIARIVKEVHFSGVTAFHRKFRERFGVTPDTFRNSPELWIKKFPELKINDN